MKISLVSLFVFFLCLSCQSQAAEDKPLKVVASFSILGDMARQIGGEDVDVTVIAGPNADLHSFQASPKDVKAINEADVIVINGLGLDRWMQALIKASDTHAKLLVASAGVKPRYLDEEKKVVDPHAWQDLLNGRLYVSNIRNALISAAPENGRSIGKRWEKYDAELKKTDVYARGQFDEVAENRRKIITSHDAFGYFGEAYGISFLAPMGVSTAAEPSAQDVAQLIEQIKAEDIKKVFIENMTDPRLMQQIADETDAEIGGTLYSDSLSAPDGPAPTYLDMIRYNVAKMKEAMD